MPQEKQNKKKRKTTFSNINFYDRKTPKENERYTWLSVILLDSTFVNSHKAFKLFLKECKYAIKNKQIMNRNNEELELDESDEEYDDSCERIDEY